MTTPDDARSEALTAVKRAQEQWEEDRRAADARRREAVLAALSAGETMTNIGSSMGLSRERVAQIRDGRTK